ncbi:nitrate- and nitrite sensing domain-containing protein [Nonomuraea sp. NPDC049152]|uniref:nitrate- and nitrite sensing domain-containing protein n=1 Tax=Nonomuraea sp. NPDC049152 TaxID=3154350 RepID=UPI0033FDD776
MSRRTSAKAAEHGGWRLRNWRVRARLVALILVPTAAAVLLGGFQVVASTSAAADYDRANQLAKLAERVGGLTHELGAERARTAWYIALGRPERGLADVRGQMSRVDAEAEKVRQGAAVLGSDITGRTGDEVATVLTRLEDLAALRDQALDSDLLPGAALDAYTTVIADLLALNDELGKNGEDEDLTRQSVTLDALARAKESVSLQQALLTTVLVVGRFEQDQLKTLLGERSREGSERKAFAAEATADERRLFDEKVNGREADRARFLLELVLNRADTGAPLKGLDLSKRDDAREWFEASTVIVESMRSVEERHAAAIVLRSSDLAAAEKQRAYLVAGAVAALLLAVLLITTGVARSLVRPLRRLRSEALDIAGERLPGFVQRLRESRDGAVTPEVTPIGVFSRDEVGEVARAFDEVHREAVRLAGEESKLRANVNAMFVNLSRRSQTLVERQLTLIERLERGERDDTRLGDLFRLDHLATRMRRNSENLLVLAGQDASRKWTQPVELMDIVRAALGEVESYDRVVMQAASEVAIAGQAVSDTVHLLAELVENAVSFSSSDTKVTISSSRIDGGGVMIAVTDHGIGMTPEEISQANWRLANPPVVDVSVSRRMGLFVVGRLALRHHIRVQLRRQDMGGLTAMVLIPESLLAAIPGQPPAHALPSQHGMPPLHAMPPEPPAAQHPMIPPPSMVPPQAGPMSYESPPLDDLRPSPASAPVFDSPPVDWFGTNDAPSADLSDFTSNGLPRRGGRSSDSGQPLGFREMPGLGGSQGPDSYGTLDRRPHDSLDAQGRHEYPDATRPLPRVETSSLDTGDEEYLPIFAAVESSWFKRPEQLADSLDAPSLDTGSAPSRPAVARPAEARPAESPPAQSAPQAAHQAAPSQDPWSSPADAGWQAARAANDPSLGGITTSGLPKRKPRANLVPGTAAVPQSQAPAQPMPPVSPDRIRSRLASYQQGVRKGRAELGNAHEEEEQR